jgi:hypothetical protein
MAADGNWNLVIETPMGERQATLSVKTEGSLLTGSQSAEGRSMDIFDGAANGNEVSWKVSITDPMDMTLGFAGAVEGDRMSGSVKLGPFGDAPVLRLPRLAELFKSSRVLSWMSGVGRGTLASNSMRRHSATTPLTRRFCRA